jgi:hypothetical protein
MEVEKNITYEPPRNVVDADQPKDGPGAVFEREKFGFQKIENLLKFLSILIENCETKLNEIQKRLHCVAITYPGLSGI